LIPSKSTRTNPSWNDDDDTGDDYLTTKVDVATNDGDRNYVDSDNAWLSATRTLGSLFLRQEDAERATRNVDVFGRPLVGNDEDIVEGHPENSFARYMMDLKLQQEENNREMMTAAAMKHIIEP
jgi:hypothetical protein